MLLEDGDLAKKYFPDTIMRSEPFGPDSKEGYVRIDAGVSDFENGVHQMEKNRAKKTNSIAR